MTIRKYPLEIQDVQIIKMPEGAQIMTVQRQRSMPCLWAAVEPNKPEVEYKLLTFGTGHPNVTGRYIGTYQTNMFVFHVFIDE